MIQRRHLTTLGGLTAALVTATTLASVPAADAASTTRCQRGSGMEAGRCFTRSTVYRHLSVAEAVPLVNNSSRTITAHCSFTRTVSRSMSAGADLGYEAKVTIEGLVDAGTSLTLHMSVSQTASQASTAGASVRLRPHQRVTCQRTYGYVTSRIKDHSWWGGTGAHPGSRTVYRTANIPSYLGVRVVD
ncbi:hypothetical protein GCM10027596_09910 [Nocardioides korecus]